MLLRIDLCLTSFCITQDSVTNKCKEMAKNDECFHTHVNTSDPIVACCQASKLAAVEEHCILFLLYNLWHLTCQVKMMSNNNMRACHLLRQFSHVWHSPLISTCNWHTHKMLLAYWWVADVNTNNPLVAATGEPLAGH